MTKRTGTAQTVTYAVAALTSAGAVIAAFPAASQSHAAGAVRFAEHAIAQQIPGAYQVVAVDLNRDSKVDVVALGTRTGELAWFENPSWERHVIAGGLSNMINVAAHDLDGDGIPELALAHGFAVSPATSTGLVVLLTHGASPADLWARRDIDQLPTTHRIRWANVDGQKHVVLVGAPLVGPDTVAPDYHHPNKIVYYEPPDWKRQTLTDAEEGIVHGILATRFGGGRGESLLSAGFLGIFHHEFRDGRWTRTRLAAGDPGEWPKSGSSDVAIGRLGSETFMVTIEPWHGNEIVAYRREGGEWVRQVLDDQLTNAHALATGDFAGTGRDAIVAGERNGKKSVYLYWPPAKLGLPWEREILDGAMPASSCVVADLNQDRRPDIVCIANGTPSVKWYENLGR